MSDAELIAALEGLSSRLLACTHAGNRIQKALDLPFRPTVLQPIPDAWRDASDVLECVKRIIRERDEALSKQ